MRRRPLALLLAATLAAPAFAQTPDAGQGLASLSDDRLLGDLASRNLETLLQRAFEQDDVPAEQRQALLVRVALSRLADPAAKLSEAERNALVRRVATEIDAVLPGVDDPRLLMEQASVLIQQGVQSDVQRLEYWGPSEAVQARLRPVVETVMRLLDKTETQARQAADAAAEKIAGPNDQRNIDLTEQAETIGRVADYTADIAGYYLALALDPADPQRAAAAQASIDALAPYDSPDNPDRNFVRATLGKLNAALGTPAGYDAARKQFDAVTADPGEPANLGVQFDAHYGRAVVELLAGDVPAAQKQAAAFDAWRKQALPDDDSAAAISQILQYRLRSAEAKAATTDAARQTANDAAVAVLLDLIQKRPDLQGVIYEQLLPKVKGADDVASLDPLLLKALMAQGQEEYFKDDPDAAKLQQGVAAAREVVRRHGDGSAAASAKVDGQLASNAAFLAPFLLEKLGRGVEAANAYLDYIERFGSDRQKAETALNNAQVLIGELRRSRADDPEVVAAFDRLLPVAVNEPFNREELAFLYAYRQQRLGNSAEAATYYARVPAGDPNYESARYFRMVALADALQSMDRGSAERKAALAEVQSLADSVRTAATKSLASATDDASRQTQRSRLVRTSLLAADLARREQDDPQRAVALLEGFESQVEGLPDANALLGEALFVRVQALTAAGQTDRAVAALRELLDRQGGQQGLQIVYELLKKLDADFDAADARGDEAAKRQLAANRATLTPFLVEYASKSADPKTSALAYQYRVLDADTQRIAADLSADPAEQKRLREAALAQFQTLETKENFTKYVAALPPAQRQDAKYDPVVNLGLARLKYALGDFADARNRFANLIRDRAVGDAFVQSGAAGETGLTGNPALLGVDPEVAPLDRKGRRADRRAEDVPEDAVRQVPRRCRRAAVRRRVRAVAAGRDPRLRPEVGRLGDAVTGRRRNPHAGRTSDTLWRPERPPDPEPTMTRLDRHVSTVRGRLALAIFVEAVAWALLALAAAVFVAIAAQRLLAFTIARPELWLAGGAGVAVLAAAVYAIVRRPGPHGAAVAIDRELGLQEKFSTALHVRETADASDPFAQAAVRDAERTADSVDLSRRFAPEFPRAGYGVAAAALAVFIGWLMIPSVNLFGGAPQVAANQTEKEKKAEEERAKANVEQAFAAMEAAPRSVAEQENLKLAKATLQDLLARPIADPQQANRTAAAAAKDLEEALKQQVATGEKFAQAKQDAKLYRQMQPDADEKGPAADAHRNIAQGNLAEAAKDIGSLAADFDKMSDAEKQAAADQMKAMAQQLKDLASDPAARQQVQQQLQQAGMTQQQAQQAQQLMQQAAQGNQQAQQQLQQMAQQAMQQMNNGQGRRPSSSSRSSR